MVSLFHRATINNQLSRDNSSERAEVREVRGCINRGHAMYWYFCLTEELNKQSEINISTE